MKQLKGFMFMLTLVSSIMICSAATVTVEKRVPAGGSVYGPFALTVMCTDSSVYNFFLMGGATGSFTYADSSPIDCSITETLTGDQLTVFRSSIGDTYGDDDGRIVAPDAKLVDGHTLFVTNILRGGGKASSITENSVPSSIPQTSDSTTNESPETLLTSGPQVSVDTSDPYTCGAGFVGKISSEDISKTQVTIDLQQQGKSVKLFSPLVNAQGVYSQALNYTDSSSPTYVSAGSYAVIVTASYQGIQDSVTFITTITNECGVDSPTNPSIFEMLKERNAHIIDAQNNTNTDTSTIKKPVAPKKLPNTGAEIG